VLCRFLPMSPSPPDVAALVDGALREFGRLDILVNNAGVAGPSGAVENIDWKEWMRTIEINLMGSVLLSRSVLPHFKQAEAWKNHPSSRAAAPQNPQPMLSAYAASKAAVIRFVETLARGNAPASH